MKQVCSNIGTILIITVHGECNNDVCVLRYAYNPGVINANSSTVLVYPGHSPAHNDLGSLIVNNNAAVYVHRDESNFNKRVVNE